MDFAFIRVFHLEGYLAFRDAHSSMNRIQKFMKQVPEHVESIKKILSSKASTKLVARMVPRAMGNIERIGKTCVSLAASARDSFVSVLNLLGEVIAVITVTQGGIQSTIKQLSIELNVTRAYLENLKREEAENRKHLDDIRKVVAKTQEEYSKAMKGIPTGAKALLLDLGRAAIKVATSFANILPSFMASIHVAVGGGGGGGSRNPIQIFASNQAINFVSSFLESLNRLIEIVSKPSNSASQTNTNQTASDSVDHIGIMDELKGYKRAFIGFDAMTSCLPQNDIKTRANGLIQRGIALIDRAINDRYADIVDELRTLVTNATPLWAAGQTSTNPPSQNVVSTDGDSSRNEILKAKIAKENLAREEERLDTQFANTMKTMEQIRIVSEKMARIDPELVDLKQIIEMLKEAFDLIVELEKNWKNLVNFFTGFADQVTTGFSEKLNTFLGHTKDALSTEAAEVDRQVIMEFIAESDGNLYHESYILYVLSRTYYDMSSKYLMPRLVTLNTMLSSKTNDERRQKLDRLKRDTDSVQERVKALVEERRQKFKIAVSERKAKINEVIDEAGADGDEDEIIEEAEAICSG